MRIARDIGPRVNVDRFCRGAMSHRDRIAAANRRRDVVDAMIEMFDADIVNAILAQCDAYARKHRRVDDERP